MAKQTPPPLTAAQREIMEVIWTRGEVTVMDVRDALAPKRELARNTVHTMLVRLEEKGWVKHRAEGRSYLYSANVPRTTSLGAKVVQLVDQFFAGSPEDMVTALIEYRGLSPEEAERIQAMIEAADPQTPAKKKRKK